MENVAAGQNEQTLVYLVCVLNEEAVATVPEAVALGELPPPGAGLVAVVVPWDRSDGRRLPPGNLHGSSFPTQLAAEIFWSYARERMWENYHHRH